jgi:hypothetical protein
MENFYLLDYLKNNVKYENEIIDLLKFELDQHIYYYGDQFKYPKEQHNFQQLQKDDSRKEKKIGYIKKIIKKIIMKKKENQEVKNDFLKFESKKNVISNAYFSFNDELKKIGYNVNKPLWSGGENIDDINLLNCFKLLKESFNNNSFNKLLSDESFTLINNFKHLLKEFYLNKHVSSLIVPYDMPFFEKLSINIFKELNKPSIVFLHGLPARYNNIDDNRADYLIVWGDKIKENYIKAGVDKNKIFVSGHPNYSNFINKELKFSFENILIITKSMNGAQQSDGVRLADRGNLILYLYSIKNTLEKLNIKSARLRVHPSENSSWYMKYMDNDFFKIDHENLNVALEKASLVIGPASTVLLESIYKGINYIVFEPSKNNIDLINFPIVPPFDGSDKRLPVAKDEIELSYIIKNKVQIDISIFNDYIKTPFNAEFIKEII